MSLSLKRPPPDGDDDVDVNDIDAYLPSEDYDLSESDGTG